MSVHFDTFKEATYNSLKKMISGDDELETQVDRLSR